jgi:hypothetical protein
MELRQKPLRERTTWQRGNCNRPPDRGSTASRAMGLTAREQGGGRYDHLSKSHRSETLIRSHFIQSDPKSQHRHDQVSVWAEVPTWFCLPPRRLPQNLDSRDVERRANPASEDGIRLSLHVLETGGARSRRAQVGFWWGPCCLDAGEARHVRAIGGDRTALWLARRPDPVRSQVSCPEERENGADQGRPG